MSKVVFLSNVDRRFAMMKVALQQLQQENLLSNDSVCVKLSDNTVWNDEWQKLLEDADILLLKWMGAGLDTHFFKKLLPFIKKHQLRYYIDAAGTEEEELVSGIEKNDLEKLKAYALYSGMKNYRNLFLYANGILTGKTDIELPDPMYWSAIYHPKAKTVYTDLAAYKKDFCDAAKPTIGILFYRDEWVWDDLVYQTALIEEIERQGMNAVCVFSNGMPVLELGMPSLIKIFEDYFCENGVPSIDVFINTMKFSLTGARSMTLDFLKKFNVPVLQAYTLLTPYENWRDDFEGMNAMEVSISVTMPEFDGAIHGVPIANKKLLENGDVRYLPINERIVRMVNKARKWAVLRRKKNADKKVAIIFHNYPPRNSNIGSAVGLDTIESIRLVLQALRERGYKVDTIPEDGKEFINELTANATNDRALLTEKQLAAANKLSGADYRKFFELQEEGVKAQLVKDWGEAPGEVMNYDDDLLIPGTWKRVSDNHSWKAAIYHIDITDNITATWDSSKTEYKYTNEDFKNTGVEITCDIIGKDGFTYNWGINYGDPKVKGTKKPYWDRKYGRWQLNGGINYTKDKWITSLQGTYLAQRVETPSSKQSFSEKPYFLTSLTTTYNADKQNSISLTLDNLLNREDNLSHSGSEYYSTPFNFLLSYNYKF